MNLRKPLIPTKPSLDELYHHGVLGMKWGVRKEDKGSGRGKASDGLTFMDRFKDKADSMIKGIGVKVRPIEMKYALRKAFNKINSETENTSNFVHEIEKQSGVLPTSESALKAVESVGIERHRGTKYDNLTDQDLANFKKYTDSARYSRNVNGYLALGEPKMYAERAAELKASLSKNSVDNLTVYRSCSLKFSMNKQHSLADKLDKIGEEAMQKEFDGLAKNYNGKSRSENRVFSTSTSPLFAIDTWRKVNPTAAASYNCYMVINCKKTPGVLADARTTKGKSLVSTHSNQEAIIAPNKLTYRNLRFDKRRKMFALTVDAE